MGLGFLLYKFTLFKSFEVVFVDLLEFGLLDEEEKLLVFINVGLLGFEDEVVFEYDNFLFHGIAETDLEGRTDLFFNIIFWGTLNSREIKNFSLRSSLIGIEFSLFSKYSFGDFNILKLNVVEGIKTDEFGVEGFMGDVELFLKLLRMEALVSRKFFEDLVLLLHGLLIVGYQLLINKLIECEDFYLVNFEVKKLY